MGDGLDLAPEPASVAAARRWCRERLEAWDALPVADTVILLVSELVTNAVVHAGTPCRLSMQRGPRLRVEVFDGSHRLPGGRLQRDAESGSGRGMLLIDRMSAAHGVEVDPQGKRVWFEVAWP